MLFLYGAHVGGLEGAARFRWVKAPTSAELTRLAQTLALRVGRLLERQGLLERDVDDCMDAGGRATHGAVAEGSGLPGYVQREFEDYLKCGRLDHGFLRVHCESCHAEQLVAFSCTNSRRFRRTSGFLPELRGAAHGRERGPVGRRGAARAAHRMGVSGIFKTLIYNN